MTQPDDAAPEAATPVDVPEGTDFTDFALADARLTVALAAAQAEFPSIQKNHEAEVRGKDGKSGYTYKYADLGDVLAAVRPVLSRHGLVIVQRTVREGQGVVLLTELKHVAGGRIDSEVNLGQSSSSPQQFGGALTYLRRYELVTLLGIAAEQDLDAANVEPVRANGNQTPAAEPLPDWARPADGAARRELLDALGEVIGAERAVRFADGIASRYGYLPVAVSTAVRSIAKAVVEEVDPLALEEAASKRAAAATAAAQDAAAEQPDTPAPEPTEEEVAAAHAELDAQAARAAGEAVPFDDVAADDSAGPPSDAVPVDDGNRPAPGSVPMPETASAANASPVRRMEVLRGAGCICPSPMENPPKLDDRCPLVNHGVPF